jgi:fimbrial chaperone protein
MRRNRQRLARLVAAVLIVAGIDPASAGSLSVSPLRVNFTGPNQGSVVEITNGGEQDLSMQVEAVEWVQSEQGADEYHPTEAIVAVPPIFTVPPGKTQLIRVGKLDQPPGDFERAYRLFITELPSPGEDATRAMLKFRMKVSLPVFEAASVPSEPRLDLLETEFIDGQLRARFFNPGNSHIQVERLVADLGSGFDADTATSMGYLLPGVSRDFYIDLEAGARVHRIKAETDIAGELRYAVAPPQ